MKVTPTQKRKWIEESITLDGYDVNEKAMTIKEKLQFIADEMRQTHFYPENMRRHGNNKAMILADLLMGLPSYFAIPFTNYDIAELGKKWGYDLSNESKEERFVNNYWNAIANIILQAFKYHKIDF